MVWIEKCSGGTPLPAMNCTAGGCLLESRYKCLLVVGTVQLEVDALLLKLAANLLQDACIRFVTKGHTGKAFNPAAVLSQKASDLRLRESGHTIREEQDQLLQVFICSKKYIIQYI